MLKLFCTAAASSYFFPKNSTTANDKCIYVYIQLLFELNIPIVLFRNQHASLLVGSANVEAIVVYGEFITGENVNHYIAIV